MRADHLRSTYALLQPATALAAIQTLRGASGKAEVEGLVELLLRPGAAPEAVAAIAALDGCESPIVLDALSTSLESSHTSVRRAALEALHRRKSWPEPDVLLRRLRRDESWLVRARPSRLWPRLPVPFAGRCSLPPTTRTGASDMP